MKKKVKRIIKDIIVKEIYVNSNKYVNINGNTLEGIH
jgi:hypothetical protein